MTEGKLALAVAWLSVCAVASAQTYTVLHNFAGSPGDGASPNAHLVRDAAGNLYTTTVWGGTANLGAVVKLDPSGNATVLHSFSGADGENPEGGLFRDAAGNLYGTTNSHGTSGFGTVFKLDSSGNFTTLHQFAGSPHDGALSESGLVQDAAGNLYGTTSAGGANNAGAVFRLSPSGNVTLLHSFAGSSDGADPIRGVIGDSAGNLYGAALLGGSFNCGVVFKLAPSGQFTVLHTFTGGADGSGPWSGLNRDSAGNLYGVTINGGASGLGVLYKIDASGNFSVLHSFAGAPNDAAQPYAGPVRDPAGNFYGTTNSGGASTTCDGGCGAIYRLSASGVMNLLDSFNPATGWNAYGYVISDGAGGLLGTAWNGGAFNSGVVFKLTLPAP